MEKKATGTATRNPVPVPFFQVGELPTMRAMPNIRACVKEGPGKVSFSEVALPDPGPGQALIRTTLTTICGSDIHIVDEFDQIPAGMPMGHESVGIVEAVGEGVETLKKGDRIVAA